MSDFLVYLFWPNPGNAHYTSPKALALLIFCVLLVAASFVVSRWRKRQNDQLRRLSRSWSSACMWFGITGLVLIVSRVEQIQYVAMRIMWVFWIAAAALYVFFQVKAFRMRYYEVLPAESVSDPRSKYLPKRKHR